MPLNSAQKRALRGKAHALKPVVILGNHGLTKPVELEIDRALNDHELIKVRVNAETREARLALTQTICDHCQAELIQTIGHVIIIYRPST
jgi:RNA-binding protein